MWSRSHPFSIVLCTCNGERYLDEQLASLRAQDGVAEIVAVDDASTDGTPEILGRRAAEDPRIRVFRNATRLGVTANFERAIGLARSPWVALSDQDDVWLPGKLGRMRARWDGVSGLVHHASRKFRGIRVPRLPTIAAGEGRKFHGRDWRRLLYRNTIVGHTTVLRADLARALAPFPAGLPHDWWLGLGAAILGRVQFVDENLVHYRIHGANAYHAAGSHYARIRAEHRLRLRLLQAVLRRPELTLGAADRRFVGDYLALLRDSGPGLFSGRLLAFYLRYASILFAGPGRPVAWPTRLRKSLTAALAAVGQAPVADARSSAAAS
jgi:glycosyltransferase involved in cell wall biosynthesis